MSILVSFTPTGLTMETYEKATRRLEEAGIWPKPDGLEAHVLFGRGEDLRVTEVWESREKADAFGEQLIPILADAGIDPGEARIFDVYKLFTPI